MDLLAMGQKMRIRKKTLHMIFKVQYSCDCQQINYTCLLYSTIWSDYPAPCSGTTRYMQCAVRSLTCGWNGGRKDNKIYIWRCGCHIMNIIALHYFLFLTIGQIGIAVRNWNTIVWIWWLWDNWLMCMNTCTLCAIPMIVNDVNDVIRSSLRKKLKNFLIDRFSMFYY